MFLIEIVKGCFKLVTLSCDVSYGVRCERDRLNILVLVEEADRVIIHLEDDVVDLNKGKNVMEDVYEWSLSLDGDFHNMEYLFEIHRNGDVVFSIDPWAKSANTNSERGVMIDLSLTEDVCELEIVMDATDALIYETHVRDYTVDESYGSTEVGFLNRFVDSEAFGIDHLKDLGVTHLHVLPVFDYTSVDDANISGTYNWGYDPFLFNVVEGSLSSDPGNGEVRINEMKHFVNVLHENGIAVVMDVVYNHTSHERMNPLYVFLPSIVYRKHENGEWGNGSGCGNELATEHPIIADFILDSLKYWMSEYGIDGFRFDLMALYDRDLMMRIDRELRSLKSDVLLYGEPWSGGVSALDLGKQFTKGAQWDTSIGMFNDEFRDGLRGCNDGFLKGLLAGNEYNQMDVLRGLVGSIHYNEWLRGFAKDPIQSINYVSAHDNLCLFDKIEKSCSDFTYEDRKRINKFAMSVLMFSQGVPFISQGTEMLYTKHLNHNSYNAGDSVNKIDWRRKDSNRDMFNFVRDVIRIRKDNKVLRLSSANEIRDRVKVSLNEHRLIGLTYEGIGEDYREMFIVHNFNGHDEVFELGHGDWLVLVEDGKVNLDGFRWTSGADVARRFSTSVYVKL